MRQTDCCRNSKDLRRPYSNLGHNCSTSGYAAFEPVVDRGPQAPAQHRATRHARERVLRLIGAAAHPGVGIDEPGVALKVLRWEHLVLAVLPADPLLCVGRQEPGVEHVAHLPPRRLLMPQHVAVSLPANLRVGVSHRLHEPFRGETLGDPLPSAAKAAHADRLVRDARQDLASELLRQVFVGRLYHAVGPRVETGVEPLHPRPLGAGNQAWKRPLGVPQRVVPTKQLQQVRVRSEPLVAVNILRIAKDLIDVRLGPGPGAFVDHRGFEVRLVAGVSGLLAKHAPYQTTDNRADY